MNTFGCLWGFELACIAISTPLRLAPHPRHTPERPKPFDFTVPKCFRIMWVCETFGDAKPTSRNGFLFVPLFSKTIRRGTLETQKQRHVGSFITLRLGRQGTAYGHVSKKQHLILSFSLSLSLSSPTSQGDVIRDVQQVRPVSGAPERIVRPREK